MLFKQRTLLAFPACTQLCLQNRLLMAKRNRFILVAQPSSGFHFWQQSGRLQGVIDFFLLYFFV